MFVNKSRQYTVYMCEIIIEDKYTLFIYVELEIGDC